MQEALTYVHKHSGSSSLDLSLSVDSKQVRLEVKDYGRGIPDERLERVLFGRADTGVGIAGPRECLRELGGSMEI